MPKTVKISKLVCQVEPADGGYDEDEFRWIVIAPKGFRFSGYQTHTMAVKYLNHKLDCDGRNLSGLSLEPEGD